ncbi:MAG: hypothetical protein HGA78_07845, partial [Nitrospirales bacterium]|nr:hypothetical protein [Nitrospirales bacterium]
MVKRMLVFTVSLMLLLGGATLASSSLLNINLNLLGGNITPAAPSTANVQPTSDYMVIGWNDLGMHCLNATFKNMMILPPFNGLYVQVVEKTDPP